MLRRLRKRVVLPGLYPAWHHVVPRALRSALDQDWRLDVEEPMSPKVVPNDSCRLVAQPQLFLHSGPPQVDVPVGQTKKFVHVDVVVDFKGRCLRWAKNPQIGGCQLDIAGRDVWVFGACQPSADDSGGLYDPLRTQLAGERVGFWRNLGVDYNLEDARPVPEVDEYQRAVVSPPMHPASDLYYVAFIVAAGRAAVPVFVHVLSSTRN